MYRLIALDLDGTLLTPQKTITPRTHAALQAAKNAGLHIVIATGQIRHLLYALCKELGLSGPQIIYNGAQIIDIPHETPLYEQLVPNNQILPTLQILHEHSLHRGYHTHNTVYVDLHTPRARTWYRPPLPQVIELPDVAVLYPRPCIKLIAVGDPAIIQAERIFFAEHFANQLYVTQGASDLLEFLHPAVSKGNALRFLAKHLGIQPEEIVAIGDNHNDVGMIQFAGLGIAMGNARPEIQAIADYVTLSNAEDGVAHALETLVLPYQVGPESPRAFKPG